MGYRAHIATTIRQCDYTEGMGNLKFDEFAYWLQDNDVYVSFNGDMLEEADRWEVDKDSLEKALDKPSNDDEEEARKFFRTALERGDKTQNYILIEWW